MKLSGRNTPHRAKLLRRRAGLEPLGALALNEQEYGLARCNCNGVLTGFGLGNEARCSADPTTARARQQTAAGHNACYGTAGSGACWAMRDPLPSTRSAPRGSRSRGGSASSET
eukprot:CAMPEP_0117683366 /NCGR_PEP_ID=MMETSP0804-20121206/20346_1 /TAXON_ID=1074897 /ORGANISM="Tetraselmis astigmatica, Strain CCMP880" /LENGTH=113 /DNA_ID=CAMNT_0005493923 /DNA_START=16 /DNA_END=355 /DNA_ORIENTATION=-